MTRLQILIPICCLLLGAGCAAKQTIPNEALGAQTAWVQLIEACAERARMPESIPCGELPPAPIQSRVTGSSQTQTFWSVLLGGLIGVAGVAAAVL